MDYMAYKEAKMQHDWYKILNCIADPPLSASSRQVAADMAIEYSRWGGKSVLGCDFRVFY